MDDTDGGVAEEVLRKYGHSSQPESQQIIAVLNAVKEVITSESLTVTPTALFAAVMSALEKPDTQESAQVTLAMCGLLGHVLPRVPNSVLRAKFNGCSHVILSILQKYKDQAPQAKAALNCLSHVLMALDPGNWPAAAAPFAALLATCLDQRPKVRKRAAMGLVEVIGSLQHTSALAHVSDAVLRVSQRVLPGPEASAKAAAAASNKQRAAAEEAITKAVADALHLLGLLKQILPLLSGSAVNEICRLLFKLYPLRQPLLSRHTTQTLEALCSARTSHISPQNLADLLKIVLDTDDLWVRTDPEAVLALTALVEGGFLRLREADPQLCSQRLPRAFHMLVPSLAAEQEGVRFGTSQALRNLIHDAIDDAMVKGAGAAAGQLPPIQSVVAAVASSLGAQYRDGWNHALPVVSELLKRLGEGGGADLSTALLHQLGELCIGAFDAGGDDATADGLEGAGGSAAHATAAEAALGTALRALGPAKVLEVLPLNLVEGLQGTAEARTWMLPLMRKHVRGGEMVFWGKAMLPLAMAMGGRAAQALKNKQKQLAATCHLLELQIWHTLPSFASWATDTPQALKVHARDLGAAFTNRDDLRPPICSTLQRICLQNRKVLKETGDMELISHSDPIGTAFEEDDDNPRPGGNGQEEEDEEELELHADTPTHYTNEVARANVEALRGFSKQWLAVLCEKFIKTPPEARPAIAGTISAYATVTDPQLLAGFFRTALQRLLKVIQDSKADVLPPDAITDGGDSPATRRCTYLELALCLVTGLDDAALTALYKAAAPGLRDREAAIQKKSYKALAYVCERRQTFLEAHLAQVLGDLLGASHSALSGAKRYRLRCIKAVILLLQRVPCPVVAMPEDQAAGSSADDTAAAVSSSDPDERSRAVVGALVAEVILGTKEMNTKARTAAYALMVQLAQSMDEMEPPPSSLDDMEADNPLAYGGLNKFFTMVLAGLVGTTPHMISATVMALARLLYEFAGRLEGVVPGLLPPVLSLLRTKSREVVKSVLGFVKVCAMRMPVELLVEQLGGILEGLLLWSEDSKNRFRLKVRVIIERLARRCGFDEVRQYMPEGDLRLLSHIRKERVRKERQKHASNHGAEDEEMEDAPDADTRSRSSKSSMARTARQSEWAHSRVFSDDSDAEDDAKTRPGAGGQSMAGKSAKRPGSVKGGRRGLEGGRLMDTGDDPMNLLDPAASRQLSKAAAGQLRKGRQEESGPAFDVGEDGKMVIRDEDDGRKRKRGGDGYDSDDSDYDDLRDIGGLSAAMKAGTKSVRFAGSIARSLGGKSDASNKSKASMASNASQSGKRIYGGDRFKAKGQSGGDVKGKSKVEPYAYWQFDRKMLNPRRGKSKKATKTLAGVVHAAQAGAAKGAKAKRAMKRQRSG